MISKLLTALLLAVTLTACSDDDASDFIEVVEEGKQNLVSLAISVDETVLDVSSSRQMTATATNKSGTTLDYTSLANWVSSDAAIASVSDRGLVSALSAGTVTIEASYGSLSDSISITASDAELLSISLTAAEISVNECQNLQMSATGGYDDGTQRNLTELVSWSSANTTLGDFDTQSGNEGLLRTFDSGTLATNASYGGFTGTTDVTINDSISSLTLAPSSFSLELGSTQAFTATASYSNGTTADISDNAQWTVVSSGSGTSIGSVDNTFPDKGTFTASVIGSVLLQAECGQQPNNTSITVTAVKEVDHIEILGGVSGKIITDGDDIFQLTATAVYTDGSEVVVTDDDDLVWSTTSGDTGIITVSNDTNDEGEVSHTGVGEVVIEAEFTVDSLVYTDEITFTVEAN